MKVKQRAALLAATGFGIGKIPGAPGTLGSLAALPLCYGLAQVSTPFAILLIVCFTIASVWFATQAEMLLDRKDPGCIVIDEIAGMLVALTGIAFTTWNAALGFALFRVFDIAKPPPIKWCEKRFTGGIGVVADDIVAGILSNITLRIIIKVFDI